MSHPRIAVAGAGVIGASIACNLALLGARRVTLAERRTIAWGATGRALGGVREQFTHAAEAALAKASIPFFEDLGPGFFRQVGYLFLARTEEGRADLEERCRKQSRLGVTCELMTPQAIRKRFPYLGLDGVQCGLFGPRDGVADTVAVTAEIVRRASENGVEIRENTDIRGVEADIRIVACGAESVEIAAARGVSLPVRPMSRQLVETAPLTNLPDDLPMTVDAETGFHFRRKGDRLVMAMRDATPRWGFEEVADESVVADRLERLRRMFPPAAKCAAGRTWAGLYDMTPDCRPILDRVEEDVFVACGFSGHGFMLSPAVGRAMAELALTGKSSTDLSPFRASRFEEPFDFSMAGLAF